MISNSENELLVYPIAEDASPISDTGAELARSVIVNMSIDTSVVEKVYIKKVVKTEKLLTILIGTASTDKLIGTFLIDDIISYTPMQLTELTTDCTGVVVIGTIPEDTFDLTFSDAFLCTRCVEYTKAPGVSSIVVNGKDGVVDSGFAEFRGDGTIFFKQDTVDLKQINVGIIDTLKSGFLGVCDWVSDCDPRAIRKIGTVSPEDDGSHKITIKAVNEFSDEYIT